MPEWYADIAGSVARPYVEELARFMAIMFFLGYVPAIVSMTFSGTKR